MKFKKLVSRVARRLEIDDDVALKIGREIFHEICAVLETEEPVSIEGLGEWYFTYERLAENADGGAENAHRNLRFRPIGYFKELMQRKVASIGIRNSKSVYLQQYGLKPEEMPALREAVNKLRLDRHLKLRRMRGDITFAEIASNLTTTIERIE